MSLFRTLAGELNLGAAVRMLRMGLKEGQLGGVLGAYFRGVRFPRAGQEFDALRFLHALPTAPGSLGRGILRGAAAGAAGLAAARLMPRNDVLAGVGAVGAFYGGYAGLGGLGVRFANALAPNGLGTAGRQITRGAVGLMAGSMVWSGLRTQRPSDFEMRG